MRWTVVGLTVALAVLASSPGLAQSGQPSFEDLVRRVKLGSKVRIEDRSGARITGRLTRLTPDEVTIETNGDEKHSFRQETVRQVATIRQFRRRGALIGAGVGLAMGALSDCRGGENQHCDVDLPILLGAGVGAIAGAIVHSTRVVYTAEETRAWVAPLVSGRRVGVSAGLRW